MVVKKCKKEDEVLNWYEINSSYPNSMFNYPIPYKLVKKVEEVDIKGLNPTQIEDGLLYQVYKLKWKEEMIIPTNLNRTNSGLNHFTNHAEIDWIWV